MGYSWLCVCQNAVWMQLKHCSWWLQTTSTWLLKIRPIFSGEQLDGKDVHSYSCLHVQNIGHTHTLLGQGSWTDSTNESSFEKRTVNISATWTVCDINAPSWLVNNLLYIFVILLMFWSDSLWWLASSTKWGKKPGSLYTKGLDLLLVLCRPVSGRVECDFYHLSQ